VWESFLDNAPYVYFILGATGAALAVLWWNTRKRKYLIALGVVAALALVYSLLRATTETDSNKIERVVQEITAAVRRQDVNALFQHISNDFHRKTFNKESFRREVEQAVGKFETNDVSFVQLEIIEIDRDQRTAQAELLIKKKSEGDAGHRCTVEFRLDPDNHWRVRTFEIMLGPVGTQPMPLPF
jgi:ketosteroid isomerase-like protein